MQEHRLAAIMFTDIVGYTSLMGRDVDAALEMLRKNRSIQKPLIEKYGGLWLKEMGDGVLAQFNSAIDSVQCALEIQEQARGELEAQIRIGIHLSDIIIEHEDVFGDGVNIASRLQAIADPGGVYISESVYLAIRGRKDLKAQFLGEIELKNVDRPVKTYYLESDKLPAPSCEKRKELKLIKKEKIRSIVVLPVENLSRNHEEQWLEAGIHHGLIDEIAKIQQLRVVPRRSTLKYGSSDKSVTEIATELDIDGVVETSYFKSGNHINIQVRLIQARPEEQQIWQNSFDNELDNVYGIYSDVAKAVAGEIHITLSPDEKKSLSAETVVNPAAYEACLKGMWYWGRLSRKDLETAMEYFNLAKKIDPDYALAYVGISETWGSRIQMGYVSYKEAAPKMEEALNRAIKLDNSSPEVHYLMALANHNWYWRWGKALDEYLITFELNPKHGDANAYYAHFLAVVGKPKEALVYAERAIELDKFNTRFYAMYAMALRHAHRFDDAISVLQEAYKSAPDEILVLSTMRSAYHDKQMYKEAIWAGKKYYAKKKDLISIKALNQGYKEGGYKMALQRNAESLKDRMSTTYITPWQIGTLYTRAGMKEEALEWLEKAFIAHDPNMPYINADPIFDYLKTGPRFQKLVEKMNFPDYKSSSQSENQTSI
jgi:adenylate cyclase